MIVVLQALREREIIYQHRFLRLPASPRTCNALRLALALPSSILFFLVQREEGEKGSTANALSHRLRVFTSLPAKRSQTSAFRVGILFPKDRTHHRTPPTGPPMFVVVRYHPTFRPVPTQRSARPIASRATAGVVGHACRGGDR